MAKRTSRASEQPLARREGVSPENALPPRPAAASAGLSRAEARRYMEMAIAAMRSSIPERRGDGKVSPKVGAVLLRRGGEVTVGFRGELRDGDHAEFTVLERKHRHEDVTGAILFATLEPCAPKARKFPKLGCAERVVLARVRQVWIGIEDPDPTVDRKGIKYLEDSGIHVEMFDRDLQEVIRAENRDFIAQALERANAAAEEGAEEVSLSPLESASGAALADLSEEALRDFARTAGTPAPSTPEFRRRLAQMGLLDTKQVPPAPTGFGFLLFGREPRVVYQNAGLLATLHYPNGKEEINDFDGPAVLIPGRAIDWLRGKLPNLVDRTEARRQISDDALFEVVREAVVNALVHRDYTIAGAKCHLIVRPDYIEVRSPGKPVSPITVEQLQTFAAPMLSRNPVLHYVFSRMELAEERGLGLKSIRARAEESGLPLPTYRWEDPYLVLRVLRTPEAATRVLPADVRRALTPAERTGWQWFSTKGRAKSSEYAAAQNVDDRVARRHLNRFQELGLARKSGGGRSTVFEVIP